MDATAVLITVSLWLLAAALIFLGMRGFLKYYEKKVLAQLGWACGLMLAAGAMVIEALVYQSFVDSLLLQTYVFLSAALVGVLSLGATRVLRRPQLEKAYGGYVGIACAILAAFSFSTPLSASSMVSGGIISGDPPLTLILISTLVTGPATVVLLASSVIALRRSWRWQTMLMIAGALVLGAGGTLYIASFPVFLYYAEFIGIVLLFLGLVSLSRVAEATRVAVPQSASAPKA